MDQSDGWDLRVMPDLRFPGLASGGKQLNLAGMLSSAVLLAVPITLGAFSGILAERSGIVNIAIEGMMLMLHGCCDRR